MKKHSFLVWVLSLLGCICFAFSVSGCEYGQPVIKARQDIKDYFVRDSIYVYDLFKYVSGQEYSFSYKYEEGEETEIKGESFFVEFTGSYTVKGTAKKGGKSDTATVEIKVVDEVPILLLKNMTGEMDLFSSSLPVAIISGKAGASIISDGSHEEYISEISVYKDGEENQPTVYKIYGAEASEDGLWDGRKINFKYECKYVVTIVSETSGGKSTANFVIKVAENLDKYQDLPQAIIYDKTTGIISWEPVPDAKYYRVKYDGKTVEQETCSINLNDVLTGEFHYFNTVVIPVDNDGAFMGKLVSEKVHLTPAGSEGVVLGGGVVSIDSETRTVELSGKQSSSPGWKSGVRYMDNSYIAFHGEYGLNTKVEFTFKGNNLPQVCFFADNLNGNMTTEGGKGFILMNGLYAVGDTTQSTSTTEVVGEHALIYLGPDRMSGSWPQENYISASQLTTKALTLTENTLFTQKALREDATERTYKYTAIVYESSGCVAFMIKLTDATTGELVEGPIIKQTAIPVSEVVPSNIIAWASVKGQYNNTVFSYELPKTVEDGELAGSIDKKVVDNGDGSYSVKMSAGHVNTIGATWAETGTIRGQGYVSDLDNYTNNFVALGEYGVGYEFVSEFTGNNMPMIMMFANDTTGNLSRGTVYPSEATNHGYVITNGIQMQMLPNEEPFMYSENVLTARGPDRIDYHIGFIEGNKPAEANGTFTTLEGEFGAFDENKNYKFIIGTKEVDSVVIMYVEIFDITDTESVVYKGEMSLNKTKTEVEALGKNVLLMAGIRGVGIGTEFTYYTPELKYTENIEMGEVNITDNKNGSYSVIMKPGHVNTVGATWATTGTIRGQGYVSDLDNYTHNYISLGEYGVGYEFEMHFKGNNMPLIMMFANNTNASLSSGVTWGSTPINYGYVITNGIQMQMFPNEQPFMYSKDVLTTRGPGRIDYHIGYSATNKPEVANGTFTTLEGEFGAFDENKDYKFIIGTKEVDSVVIMYVEIYDITDTETVVYKGEMSLDKTKTEVEELGKNVLLMAGVRGEGVRTEFTYYTPTFEE